MISPVNKVVVLLRNATADTSDITAVVRLYFINEVF